MTTPPHDSTTNQLDGATWASPQSPPTLPPPPTDATSAPPPTPPDPSGSDHVEPPRRRGRRWAILAAAAAGLVVAAGGVLAIGFRSSDGTPRESAAFQQPGTAPTTIEAKFQLDTDRVTGEYGRLVADVDDGDRIVQYDEIGNERWSFDVPSDWTNFIVGPDVGGRIPVHIRIENREPELFVGFLDADSGALTDTEIDLVEGEREFAGTPFAGHLPVWGDHSLKLYDPLTGEMRAEIRADEVGPGTWADVIFAIDGDQVSIFDLDLQPIVTGVEIGGERAKSTPGIGDVTRSDVVDGRLITVDGNLIVGNDDTGTAWTIDPGMGELDDARSLGDDAWLLRLATGETVIVKDSGGDKFKEVWRGSDVGAPQRVDGGTVLFPATDLVLVSAEGDVLYEADDSATSSSFTVDNGFLIGRERGGITEVTLVDSAGVEHWSIETDTQVTWLQVVDDVVFDPQTGMVYGPE